MNLLKKIFSPTLLLISFLLLIYIFYRSEIFWDGNNRHYYKTYYLISLILICFSIITFFINKEIKLYLIISGISLIVTLYLFEGYLTFKDQPLKYQLYEKQTGNKWDRRSLIEIFNDLQKTNNEIVISVRPINYLEFEIKKPLIFPLSGISNSATIHCNENGYYSIYKSDRYGFNNPDIEWDKKEIEYLLVGDSFTHGACVNRPNDISSVLRKLSNKPVLNLGMGGNDPLIEYATLVEYLNDNVKKILWIFYEGNDLNNPTQNEFINNYLKDKSFNQNLKFRQNTIDKLGLEIIKETNSFKKKLIKFIKFVKVRFLIRQILAPTTTLSQMSPLELKRIIRLAKELTVENNSKLYFVYLPSYERYKKNDNSQNYNLVKNIVTELKIPFIDIHKEVFEKEQNPLKLFPFELHGHYNVDGYKKIAEAIYKFTKD